MSTLMKWNDKFMAVKMKAVKKNVTLACIHIQTDVKTRMSKPGTGIEYRSRGSKNVMHTASREGEAPAVDLGELRNGVVYKVEETKNMHLVRGRVGVREGLGPRAWHLETTLNRPAFVPALAAEMPRYFARLKGK